MSLTYLILAILITAFFVHVHLKSGRRQVGDMIACLLCGLCWPVALVWLGIIPRLLAVILVHALVVWTLVNVSNQIASR